MNININFEWFVKLGISGLFTACTAYLVSFGVADWAISKQTDYVISRFNGLDNAITRIDHRQLSTNQNRITQKDISEIINSAFDKENNNNALLKKQLNDLVIRLDGICDIIVQSASFSPEEKNSCKSN